MFQEVILPIDLEKKTKMYQNTYPKYSFFENPTDLGGGSSHYKYESEEEYYKDLFNRGLDYLQEEEVGIL